MSSWYDIAVTVLESLARRRPPEIKKLQMYREKPRRASVFAAIRVISTLRRFWAQTKREEKKPRRKFEIKEDVYFTKFLVHRVVSTESDHRKWNPVFVTARLCRLLLLWKLEEEIEENKNEIGAFCQINQGEVMCAECGRGKLISAPQARRKWNKNRRKKFDDVMNCYPRLHLWRALEFKRLSWALVPKCAHSRKICNSNILWSNRRQNGRWSHIDRISIDFFSRWRSHLTQIFIRRSYWVSLSSLDFWRESMRRRRRLFRPSTIHVRQFSLRWHFRSSLKALKAFRSIKRARWHFPIGFADKNEYASVLVGSDKHKYGYELKQNRQFHHTTTEEDGVRLGCYGHILEGKKYSTQYVADIQGYRPVLTHDAITVYPKSGGERWGNGKTGKVYPSTTLFAHRKASFVGNFNEDQQRSQNIRYFFPDGCKGSDVNVMSPDFPLPNPPIVVAKKTPGGISPPDQGKSTAGSIQVPVLSVQPPFERPEKSQSKVFAPPQAKVLPPKTATPKATTSKAPVTKAPTPKPVTKPAANKNPILSSKAIPNKSNPLRIAVPLDMLLNNKLPKSKDDSCPKTCCTDDESVAKLVLPISMKSLGKSSGTCESFAKLVIPVEGLNPDSLKSLTKGGDTADLIKTILQSLS